MIVPQLNISISPVDGSRVSFKNGHNSITVTYRSDISLVYEEIRVTKGTTGYDIGVGAKVHSNAGSISANENHTCTFAVNSTNFSEGDGIYTISLYVKAEQDGSWNEYHFFITVDDKDFITSDNKDLMVVTDQAIPS